MNRKNEFNEIDRSDLSKTTQYEDIWVNDREKFPRKQMLRDRWISLDGAWNFSFDNYRKWNQPQDVDNWSHQITVPFAPESKASGVNDTSFHFRCWYEKQFNFQPAAKKRYLIHFGAVDYEAKVWINNQYLGCHVGGYSPFSFDITDFILSGQQQSVVLCADDDPLDLAKPRGKQDWQLEPHMIWYPRTTGIWQHVWIEEVPEVYIDKIHWSPHMERWEIGCEAYVKGERSDKMRLRVRLSHNDKTLADDSYQIINREVHRRIALSDPGIDDYRNELLWSPEKPNLITAEVEILIDDKVLDRVVSYTALKSAEVQRGRFLLNGRPYFLRMVLNQGYWPETMMTPPSSDHIKRDIELIKSAGFNGARMHQKIEDPDFLYWADHLGLLVWEEMPSAYRFTQESVKRLMKEWSEIIDRDSNHPCIVVWVTFNESWGVPDLAAKEAHQNCVQAMYHLTRTLDPTRLVIGNDGWESTATDILGIHDYDDQPQRLIHKYGTDDSISDFLNRRWPGGRALTVEGYPHKGQPIMLTEFGGISCLTTEETNKLAWGYSNSDSSDDLQRRYESLLDAVHNIDCFGGFCYTQFTDTFQEANGLFTMDRRPKFSLSSMARATRHHGQSRGELTSSPMPPPLAPTDHGQEQQNMN